MRRDSFRPSLNGFRFPNAFSVPGTTFGLGAPLLPSFGLGAGMAWVALDRYLAGRPVPSDAEPPSATSALHAELVMRQANALTSAPWNRLIEWQCLPERSLPGRPSLAACSRRHWRRTRQSLDAGVPVLLILVLGTGRHTNPSSNKAVLAVGYEIDRGERTATVMVYDPDRPGGDNVRLVFRTGPSGPLDARLAAEAQVRGFFSVPYDRALPATLSLDRMDSANARRVEAVIGMLASDRSDGPLHVLAEERSGGLVQIRRDRRGRWSAQNVQKKSGEARLTNASGGALIGPNRILARADGGELLDIRRLPALGWRARNITLSRRIGDGFRIDGSFGVLRRRNALTVIGCGGGKLIRYRCNALGVWKAELIHCGGLGHTNFVGTPALVEQHDLHVLCRTDSDDLIHLREDRKVGWVGTSVTVRPGGRTRFLIADDPIVLSDPAHKALNAVARSKDGAVLLFRWTEQRGWATIDLTMSARTAETDFPVAASPLSAVMDEEGTLHMAARDAQGGLIHLWRTRNDANGGERVGCTRGTIGKHSRIDGAPFLALGAGGALHIFARHEKDLLLFRWAPVGDWSVENVGRERRTAGALELASDPVLACEDHAIHVAFPVEDGGLYHACVAAAKRGRVAAAHRPPASGPRRATPKQPIVSARSQALGEATWKAAQHVRNLLALVDRARAAATRRPAPTPPSASASTGATQRPPRPAPSAPARTRPAAVSQPQRTVPGRPGQPQMRVPPPATAVMAPPPDQTGEAPASQPQTALVLDGLPLLPEGDRTRKPPAPLAGSPVPQKQQRQRDDEREMQRLMALADKEPPVLIRPT